MDEQKKGCQKQTKNSEDKKKGVTEEEMSEISRKIGGKMKKKKLEMNWKTKKKHQLGWRGKKCSTK